MRKALILGVAGAMAIAVPAVAKTHSHHSGTHGKSHKCAIHKVGYTAGGPLVSFADNGDGTYTVVFTVAHANHHAWKNGATKGSQLSETVPSSSVTFDDSLTSTTTAAGDNVQVVGKVTTKARKCTDTTGTGVVTIKKIVIGAPAS